MPVKPLPPEEFGDNYSDQLTREDKEKITNYFKAFETLPNHFGSIIFTVGGEDFGIKLSEKKASLRFEAPRGSLLTSVKYEIFDDMLIGNFMKTTLIGSKSLYPNFTPFITKYGDNGTARSKTEIVNYFDYYKLNSADYWRDMLIYKTEGVVRSFVASHSKLYNFGKIIRQKY